MDKHSKGLKNWMISHIDNIISYVIGLAGVVATIMSAICTVEASFVPFYIALLSFESILLVLWLVVLAANYRWSKKNEELESEKNETNKSMIELKDKEKTELEKFNKEREEIRKRVNGIATIIYT